MYSAPFPNSRGMMFEFLRREGAAQEAAEKLLKSEPQAVMTQRFLETALNSWNIPEALEPDGPSDHSAPEPAGDHEFFRAVGA